MADSAPESDDAWAEALTDNRAEKDRFFADHPQSPIPPEARDDFDGLEYYQPDPSFRVQGRLDVHAEPDPIDLEMTEGQPRRYLQVATLRFTLNDAERTLVGLRQSEDEDGLFVPFTDATTGDGTYGRGRYLEFEPTDELVDGGTMTLDFNLAYNPFCAYSETFACPLPPAENHLDVAVRAGERAPPETVTAISDDS
mgnify:FL=1